MHKKNKFPAGFKVLVVDDNEVILAYIRHILLSAAIACRTLDNPAMIHEAVSRLKPDVLLMDICYSNDDGRNICQELKTHPEHFFLPIILFSGNPMDAESIADAKADGFLEKPFTGPELLAMLEEVGLSREVLMHHSM